ncbi:MAG: lipid-A-disaccharide synthase [Gammaproteobacteria bacterium]|nr:lipid-A-disaccharide synthase [Gammaproteobacteria bacterium]
MKIAVLAGEPSGDVLGAGLIAALRKHFPQARFEGIGGELMQAQGCASLFPLEKLSVMGLVEVLGHLPELLRIQRSLCRHFLNDPPAVFIGIDAPDFNLRLERRLRVQGIRTVHYVSPQIWAWRSWRVRKIGRTVDLMLALLPFEATFYERHGVPVRYVGHPLADDIPLSNDSQPARRVLGLQENARWLALLPGSRLREVKMLGPIFVETALWLHDRLPELKFVVAVATPRIHQYLTELLQQLAPRLPIQLIEGRSRAVLTAADVVLLASGTATLETMLVKRPMVVAYKLAPLTAWIATRLIRISHYALPNLLANRKLVPEFMQAAATPANLGPAVLDWLNDAPARETLTTEFATLHRQLRCDASARAAAAVAELLARNAEGGG